jgi:hypothetical protein
MQRAHHRVFVFIGLINNKGLEIACTGPHSLTGVLYFYSEWFKKTTNSSYFISDVFKRLR